MTEPSKKPRKKKGKPASEMTDDELIASVFPKKVVKELNRLVGRTPTSGPYTEKDSK